MPGKRNPLVRHTLFCLTYFFFHLTRMLPLSLSRLFGTLLAEAAYHTVPRIKKVGLANLETAYGDSLSMQEKRRILRGSVRNLGRVATEFPHLPRLIHGDYERFVTVRGVEHMDPTRGAVLIGAHLGNWEWMLPVSVQLGMQAAAVVREFDDPRMNALVDRVRKASGVTIVSKDNAMGALLREIRSGTQVGLLADQNPRTNAVPVTFFGQPTWATIGPALLAMRAKTAIHPISIVRCDRNNYIFEFHPAIDMVHTGNMIDDLKLITQRCQDALEQIIRNHPEQWLWFHRRWKRRERLEREWQTREARHGVSKEIHATSEAPDTN